jgi:hypothetical protein
VQLSGKFRHARKIQLDWRIAMAMIVMITENNDKNNEKTKIRRMRLRSSVVSERYKPIIHRSTGDAGVR